ncbi:MAG: tripartite tricarboxylate transporter substrate binding protein [Burkholderiales bacterium]|nr:tripartite tricarboxylate transporter substrate binding protein [Burkholderiales bacterium]
MPKRTSQALARCASALAAAALLWAMPAQADPKYPERPVKVIASFPAGQATDVAARLLADALAKEWNAPVVVQNQAGGLGVPAMLALKNAPGDGYTLGIGTTGTMATNAYLLKDLPYSPLADYTLVAPFFTAPLVVIASPAAPFKTLRELTEFAKRRPDTVTWAIPGSGSAQHIAGERLFQQAGIALQRVSYKGSGPALQDLIGGQVMLMTDSLSASLSLIESGRVVPLAVTSAQRVPQLPNVPTVAELGFPGFNAYGWGGVLAPASTPEPIVKKIADAVRKVMADPAFQERLQGRALAADLSSPQEWQGFVKSQIDQIREVLTRVGVPRQ